VVRRGGRRQRIGRWLLVSLQIGGGEDGPGDIRHP